MILSILKLGIPSFMLYCICCHRNGRTKHGLLKVSLTISFIRGLTHRTASTLVFDLEKAMAHKGNAQIRWLTALTH